MQSTSARPNSDTVSGDSAASVRGHPPTRIGTGVSANVSQDGNARSGGADDKSSAPTNEAVEAAMAKEMERFIERGPPSNPTRGPSTTVVRGVQPPRPSSNTSPGSAQPIPNTSATGTGRSVQTATANTASMRKKK